MFKDYQSPYSLAVSAVYDYVITKSGFLVGGQPLLQC